MRLTEIFQTMPSFIFIFVVVAVFTPSVPTIVLAIAIVSWPQLARLVRGEFIALRGRDFVQACIAIGMSDLRDHLLPGAAQCAGAGDRHRLGDGGDWRS